MNEHEATVPNSPPEILIVGAGPAGMMLAYQLVGNGIPVRVLERHPDFEREFRGELIGPSVLPALQRLGLLPLLAERGLVRTAVERRMFVGARRRVTLPTGLEQGALISQPGLLTLLHELCGRHQGYRLDFRTTAVRAVRDRDRVTGLQVRCEGAEDRVDGDVVVVCNGRNSRLRQDLNVPFDLERKPGDTLWLRIDLSGTPELLPSDVDVHMFGGGVVVVLFATTGSRLQIGYSAPGDLAAMRANPAALREALLPRLNGPLRPVVAAHLDDAKTQVLKVSIDRMSRWHAPGILLLGDAAHTMGPAGAQGLNLAIRDSIVAANHIINAVRVNRPVDSTVFSRIETERRPEIETAQAAQLRAYGMSHKPLPVLHTMITLLAAVTRVTTFTAPDTPIVEPRYPVTPRFV